MEENVEKKNSLTAEGIIKALDTLYKAMADGIPFVSPPIDQFAQDYLKKNKAPDIAAKEMIRKQIQKCTVSGFLTSLGGFITLPVAIPANIGSVLYVQMRMIACVAYMAGYDIDCDQVQTLIYACLAGVSINGFVKKAGIKTGEKLAFNMIKKIPGTVITKINQKIGFRFITKFGTKGIINLGKMIPVVSGFIGGTFDFVETRTMANCAYKMFFEGDFSGGTEEEPDDDNDDIEIEAEGNVE